jgi:hypothetical protein
MTKTAYLSFNVRVCGQENVGLSQSCTQNPSDPTACNRFFIFAQASGAVSSMDDSTRYFTTAESTFGAYFALFPTSDPCTIKEYSLLKSLIPIEQWDSSDTRARLLGSIGSYNLKIDKSVPANG